MKQCNIGRHEAQKTGPFPSWYIQRFPQAPMSPFYDRLPGLFEWLPCMNAVDIVRVRFICGHPMNGMCGIGGSARKSMMNWLNIGGGFLARERCDCIVCRCGWGRSKLNLGRLLLLGGLLHAPKKILNKGLRLRRVLAVLSDGQSIFVEQEGERYACKSQESWNTGCPMDSQIFVHVLGEQRECKSKQRP